MTNQYAHSPKLRLLSAVLAAALALTLLPAAAFAEDAVEYDLKFGGIQVTSANAGIFCAMAGCVMTMLPGH